jgi:predicted enzyme related to lactoylglutathione lyase
MTRLVHFEITSTDVDATADFYAGILAVGSEPSPFAPNYILLTGENGPIGAVMGKADQVQAVIIWFTVDDLDAVLKKVAKAGGRQMGKINTIPGQGRLAYASDPNGTIFGLKQETNT